MKRGADDAPDGYPPFKRSSAVPRAGFCVKALAPDFLVKCILGPRGSTKDEIQRQTSTKIIISNKDDFYPGTNYRSLNVYSDVPRNIQSAFEWILPKIVESGEEEKRRPPPSGPDLLGKEPGEYVLRLIISKNMASVVIGVGGSNIKQLRTETGAKVFVENRSVLGHQMVRIVGVPDSLLTCLERIARFIHAEPESEAYACYASLINFHEAEQSGNFNFLPLLGDPDRGYESREHDREQHSTANEQEAPVEPLEKQGWHSERRAFFPRANGSAPSGDTEMRAERLAETMKEFPAGKSGLQYSMTCELPSVRVQAFFGKGSDFIAHVERTTGAAIVFSHSPNDEEDAIRSMSIVGPLLSMYAAHILVVKKAHEDEEYEIEMEEQRQKALEERREEEERQQADAEGTLWDVNGQQGAEGQWPAPDLEAPQIHGEERGHDEWGFDQGHRQEFPPEPEAWQDRWPEDDEVPPDASNEELRARIYELQGHLRELRKFVQVDGNLLP
mmetsp:Transcript_1448/g.3907  ORF Transcript_1448/g.3907 Transcript_1448/m.3907 type:complete len:501 (-) Transcript_1448:102-1604(-)